MEGSGSEADPYKISTTADWDQLGTDVNGGTSYSGKYFVLTTNITVTTMVGKNESGKRFQGTFNTLYAGNEDEVSLNG